MRRSPFVLFLLLSVFLAPPILGQTLPPIFFVSGFTGGEIFRVDGTTGDTKVIFRGRRDFVPRDLVVGPDNKLYVAAGGQVLRMDQDGKNAEIVYDRSMTTLLAPPSGVEALRFNSDADLFFSTAGDNPTGVWKIAGAGTTENVAVIPAPVNVIASSTETKGLALTPEGNLLVVQGDTVLLAEHPEFTPVSNPIITGLNNPVGVAVDSLGNIYIAVEGDSGKIVRCNPDGTGCADFAILPNQPFYLEIALDDTVFIATAKQLEPTKTENGEIWRCPPGSDCEKLASLLRTRGNFDPAVGAGLSATCRTVIAEEEFQTKAFKFGQKAGAFEISAFSCGDGTAVTACQRPPAEQQAAMDRNGIDAEPMPYVGLEGFAADYLVQPEMCQLQNGFFGLAIGAFLVETSDINPKQVNCVGDDLNSTCDLLDTTGYYPLLELIPGDAVLGSRGPTFSTFFLADHTIEENVNFLGFESPFDSSDPFDPTLNVFNAGRDIPHKFRLSDGSCATAVLAVARIADAEGTPDFERINISPSGDANDPPFFRCTDGNHIFNLSTDGLPPGTYASTVSFESNETFTETILWQLVE